MRRFVVFALFSVVFCSAWAGPEMAANNARLEAEATISSYRRLRKECAGSHGVERSSCFARLHKQNEKYQVAKEFIARAKPANVNNLHVVSEVY